MKKLVVLVGLPGSGKSTYLNFVDDPEFGDTVFVYSTDALIEKWSAAMGWTYDFGFSKYIDKATKEMNSKLELALSMGVDIYWDQTNMSAKKRKSILSKFPKSYRKVCWCIVPPRNPEEWHELRHRLSSRKGKNIPDNVVNSMYLSYVEPELEEGFTHIKIVDIFGKIVTEKGVE